MDKGAVGTDLIFYNGNYRFDKRSEALLTRIEIAQQTELQRYMTKAKDSLTKNKECLEKVSKTLHDKKFITYSEIQDIKGQCDIVSIAMR